MPSRGVFGIEVLKSIQMKNGLHFSPRRVGKWTIEEEHFAKKLIDQFEAGTLTDCQAGTTLRCYLSRRLNCDPMRISKKFAGKSIGKHTYVSRLRDLPPQSISSPTTIPVPDLDLQSMGLVSQDPSDSLPLPPVSDVFQVPSSTVPIPSNISIPIIEEKENKKKLQSVVSFDTFTKYHKVQLEESLKPSNHKECSNWSAYRDNSFSTTNGNNLNISMNKRPFEEAFPCLPDVDVHTTTSDVGLSIDEDDDEYDHQTIKRKVEDPCSMEVTPSIPPSAATTTAACDVNGTQKPIPIAWVPVPVIPKQPLNDPSTGKQFTPVSTVPRWDAPLSTWEQQGIGALATPTAMLSSGAAGGMAFTVSPSASAATATTLPVVNFTAHSVAQNTTTATLQAVPAAIPCTISDNTSETGTETENMTGTEIETGTNTESLSETGSQTGLLSETMTETGSQKGLSTETSSESDYNTGTETGYHTETDATTVTSKAIRSDIDNKGWNDVLDILLLEEISPVVDTSLYRNSSVTSFNL